MSEKTPSTAIQEESVESIQRRIALLELRKKEKEYELVEADLEKHNNEKENRKRTIAARRAEEQSTREEMERLQSICLHNTGGLELAGIFKGNGKHGRSVNVHKLDLGVEYVICTRCNKQWFPSWFLIYQLEIGRPIHGQRQFTRDDKEAINTNSKAYYDALGWSHELSTPSGGMSFSLGKLERFRSEMQELGIS